MSNRVRTGDLRNHNPAAGGSKCLSSPEVAASGSAVGPSVGQNSRPDDPSGGDFGAAISSIMSLPLSDSEKAEAVRRLLSHGGP